VKKLKKIEGLTDEAMKELEEFMSKPKGGGKSGGKS
jgi:hypothetical protein